MSLRNFLEQGPFTLALSAGFFGFFAHAGVLAALEEAGFLPARITGASAGALAGGAWAAGLDSADFARELFALQRRDFWDVGLGFGLLRGELFRARLERLLPVTTLEQCRVPLAIAVYDLRRRRTVAIRSGPLAAAIHASCAVPGMFHPVSLGGSVCIDGGTFDRSSLVGVTEEERVLLHFLGSRSPWRRRDSPSLKVPVRERMHAVLLDALPRVDPFRLERGPQAYAMARDQVRRLLDRSRMPVLERRSA